LERILRPFDRDAASLPARLAALTFDPAQNKSALIDRRHEVTTESWDLPVFSAGLPTHLHQELQNDLPLLNSSNQQIVQAWIHPQNITDLLKAYYFYQLLNDPSSPDYSPPADPNKAVQANNAAPQANTMVNVMTSAQLLNLFPPEMLAGLKMNINHPFPGPGTGASNDPNAFGMAALWQSLGVGGNYGNFWFGQMPDYPDGTYDAKNAPFAARQRYARYLYVLAMLLRDPNAQAQWFTEAGLQGSPQGEQLTKRRIAQWAINAACFKVNDSIMVAFEYDMDPLGYNSATNKINGWRVDGVIDKNPTDPSYTGDDHQLYRGLVWGCKPPELILTETLAFHDRRIADTTWEKSGGTKTTDPTPHDMDFDQTRIPQGSAFFELYCPRDLHGSTPPPDLYDANNRLDLGKLAPPDTVNNIPAYPVWRMVISESTKKNPPDNDINTLKNIYPDSLSFEPDQYTGQSACLSLLNNDPHVSLTAKVSIDRIVWFASMQPITKMANPTAYHMDADRIYYNYAGMPTSLDRGHYALIGPRATTVLGLTNDITTDPNYNKSPIGKPSNQRIILSSDTVPVKDLNGTFDSKIDDPANPNHIDQNKVKLPLEIIVAGGGPGTDWPSTFITKVPVGISISEPLFSSPNYYPEPSLTGPDGVKEWYGDWQMANPAKGYFRDTPLDIQPGTPLADDKIGYDPTTGLPNSIPTANYKTVFLQRLANPSAPYDPVTNPYLTVDWMPVDLTVFNGDDSTDPYDTLTPQFATRQRGITNFSAPENPPFPPDVISNPDKYKNNLWAPYSNTPVGTGPVNITPKIYFNYNLVHSLGYLNQAFQPFITNALGKPAELYGDPATQPFPWLPWLGRPYVSQLELMLVPASHPARLLWEFQPCSASTVNYMPLDITQAPFPQLLNFLQSGNGNGMNQFGRILDYVGVPSWFEGTEIQANPNLISPNGIPSFPGTHTFFPPYNNISTYREPGRINLNTIYSPDVFNGLMNGNQSPNWTQFVTSRGDNYAVMNPAYPTEFNNPFRSGGSVYWNPNPPTPSLEINATYMRPSSTGDPLFQQLPQHLIPPQSQQDVNNTDRNPFFHYQGLERLGNLVTTRSNVYSVWITVGYFEVKPNRFTTPAGLPDLAHPDGYELGQEMGSDTGEIVRHRAFYMIDRTIPVGFQRGQDLNVEKAIILKRYIE
jgi:hypothetical protein